MAKTRHNLNQTFKKPATINDDFADDHVITANTEDNLQKAAH
jgi:hypothetical protein